MAVKYHDELNQRNMEKIHELENELPSYVHEYILSIAASTTTRTRLRYLYNLRIFFLYLKERNPEFAHQSIATISCDQLDMLTANDLDEYMDYLRMYRTQENNVVTNNNAAIKQKLSSVRSLFHFLYKREYIRGNPAELIRMPKIRDKAIIHLEPNESAALLAYVEEKGATLSGRALQKYNREKSRDLAIITTLLGTGIRVSELVGLDLDDVDFDNNSLMVFRKGEKESFVYFGDEVSDALEAYMDDRLLITADAGHKNALFLSDRKQRISVRTVERLVKSYSSCIATNKKITPHGLRRSYGTALYEDTSDIYLVSSALGHRDINTTKKHYAAMDENRKRSILSKFHLRESRDDGQTGNLE